METEGDGDASLGFQKIKIDEKMKQAEIEWTQRKNLALGSDGVGGGLKMDGKWEKDKRKNGANCNYKHKQD